MMMKRRSLLEELEAMRLQQRLLHVNHAEKHEHVMDHVCAESRMVEP